MPAGSFPPTRYSIVSAIRSEQPDVRRAAFDTLVNAYWKPVFKYVRVKWHASPEEAADLTQGFFLRAFEKDFFGAFDARQARFRTFLRTCLDGFVANARKADRRLKRGGHFEMVSLDFDTAERELQRQGPNAIDDFDAYFHREWLRTLFAEAARRLRDACAARDRARRFTLFERYDLADDDETRPTYAVLARELGLAASDVTNELAAARREFRRLVLDVLREQCASDEEFDAEARAFMRSGT
jgi:RNA polymerase sigma factor (sigma-70 family)